MNLLKIIGIFLVAFSGLMQVLFLTPTDRIFILSLLLMYFSGLIVYGLGRIEDKLEKKS